MKWQYESIGDVCLVGDGAHTKIQRQNEGKPNQFEIHKLGEYVDRLLAKAIITFAQTYYAGSIVLPKLGNMRELVQSEIQSTAEQKIPGYIEGQEKYAKQYRTSVHQWSYGRLIDNNSSKPSRENLGNRETSALKDI